MAKSLRKIVLPTPANPTTATPEGNTMATDAAPATAELELNTPHDPRLPAGITSNAPTSNAPNGDEDTGPDEADVPAGQKTNKVAMDKGKYFDEARKLGDTKIKGDNSLFSLAELALNGGRAGVLVVARENADNDAYKLYERFYNPNTGLKKAKWAERVENGDSLASNVKKVEWFIKLGGTFRDDGYKFFHQAHGVYKSMMADDQTRKSMKYTAAYEAVLSIVRPFMMDVEKAMKANKPVPTAADMPDEEKIRGDLLKPEKGSKDAMAILAEAYKMIHNAYEGKAADGKLRKVDLVGIKDDRLTDALQLIRDVAADQGPEVEKEFITATSEKPKKAKKANGEASANGEEGELPDAPIGSEGPDSNAVEAE